MDTPDMRQPSEVTDEPWVWVDAPGRPDPSDASGKWLVFRTGWDEVDRTWTTIRDAVLRGELGQGAKVATPEQGPPRAWGTPIIVYTLDARDKAGVDKVLAGLRSLGIQERLSYKADEVTAQLRYGRGTAWYVAQRGAVVSEDRREPGAKDVPTLFD